MDHELFAVAAPGVEQVLATEVAALPGAQAVAAVPGGVTFRGDEAVLYRANLWLRSATRVLLRVGTVEAQRFGQLRQRAAELPWERFVRSGAAVAVSASQSKCRLYHTGAVAESLVAAVSARLGTPPPAEGVGAQLYARGQANVWTLSIDTSGELLHRRGWRQETAHAPLRESLAAAMLLLCRFNPAAPLYDPMCGAGTLPLEACCMAMGIAPGLQRRFACEAWPTADPALWRRLRDQAEAARLPRPPAPIGGSDLSPLAVAAARQNAARAGLADQITLSVAALEEVAPSPGPGLVIANPPYGRRVGDPRALRTLYSALGRVLRDRFAGWRGAVLLSDPRLITALGAPVTTEHPLVNGGLRVRLVELAL